MRDPALPPRTPKKREALPDVLTLGELERLLAYEQLRENALLSPERLVSAATREALARRIVRAEPCWACLDELNATRADGEPLVLDEATVRDEPVIELRSPRGELKIVAEPAGTRGGHDDLRRAATREPIGKGLRLTVASTSDLARMLAALGRYSPGYQARHRCCGIALTTS